MVSLLKIFEDLGFFAGTATAIGFLMVAWITTIKENIERTPAGGTREKSWKTKSLILFTILLTIAEVLISLRFYSFSLKVLIPKRTAVRQQVDMMQNEDSIKAYLQMLYSILLACYIPFILFWVIVQLICGHLLFFMMKTLVAHQGLCQLPENFCRVGISFKVTEQRSSNIEAEIRRFMLGGQDLDAKIKWIDLRLSRMEEESDRLDQNAKRGEQTPYYKCESHSSGSATSISTPSSSPSPSEEFGRLAGRQDHDLRVSADRLEIRNSEGLLRSPEGVSICT
ncbi:hypothetical protein MMC20_007606 [Loxospora ochrophaea]|nr:hypothetical protein [Loxospora ochrophaea]